VLPHGPAPSGLAEHSERGSKWRSSRHTFTHGETGPNVAGLPIGYCDLAVLFSSAGQLTITVSGCTACSAVSSTRKRCPSRAAS